MGLSIGAKGPAVATLQRRLKSAGATLADDGVFGPKTDKALRRYQRQHDLVADGIFGPKTEAAFNDAPAPATLTHADIRAAAKKLDVDVPAVLAVNEVESRGAGFDGHRPVILYERHIMRRRLAAHSLDARGAATDHPKLVNKQPGGYAGGAAEWMRFNRAAAIDRASAIEATSWGLFQILGQHWQRLGYDSADDYAAHMRDSEAAQLSAFVAFIQTDDTLAQALASHDWATFAATYNGPNYAQNDYDHNLAAAWRRHGGQTAGNVA
ncbi:DUF3380 domain-containing protein [Salinisphaera sp. USBA-960]|nr:DUF3380 domain-containing protein [Salifodinibacter halophilus]NNC25311.1 DUF3380 domain-containing protein [Salifodinibacter halophilus]